MTSFVNRDQSSSTPDARYHNSGFGPREMFRTSAVGKERSFDIYRTLRMWSPTADDTLIRRRLRPERSTPLAPEIIDRACTITLDLLGISPAMQGRIRTDPAQRALRSITTLACELAGSGLTNDLVGIASEGRGRDIASFILPMGVDILPPLEVATTLVAASVFAPPLILWTREPSFTWWRTDCYISLRMFESSKSYTGDDR